MSLRSRLSVIPIVAFLLCAARIAPATTVVCQQTISAFGPSIPLPVSVADGAGGLVVIGDGTYCSSVRLDAANTVTSWPAPGANSPGANASAVGNGSGGLLAAWVAAGPMVQASRWTSTGAQFPPGADTISTVHAGTSTISIAADGSGGAYVAWVDDGTSSHVLYVQHVQASVHTTPNTEVALCSVPAGRVVGPIVSDGAGGAIVVWTDGRSGGGAPYDVFAQRVDGSLAAQWSADGVPVAALAGSNQQKPTAATDGAGGAFVAWEDGRGGSAAVYLQRLTGAGAPFAGWATNGFAITPTGMNTVASLADAAGGVYLAWNSGSRPVVQHVGGDGFPVAGWGSGLTASSLASITGVTPFLASDHAGGVRVAWIRQTGATSYMLEVQTFTAAGGHPAGWPDDGIAAAPGGYYGGIASLNDASDGTVFAVWQNSLGGLTTRDVSNRVQHLGVDGLVAVKASFVDADVRTGSIRLRWFVEGLDSPATIERTIGADAWIALGPLADEGGYLVYQDREVSPGTTYRYRLAWTEDGAVAHSPPETITVPAAPSLALAGALPNPASGPLRIVFALPAGAARTELALFDPAGRRHWSSQVVDLAAGRHAVDVGVALAPGIYRLRLTCGRETRETTVAVIR